MKEIIYRDIKSGYKVTENGDIITPEGKVRSTYINDRGYKTVSLPAYNSRGRRTFLIHEIITHVYLGKRPKGLYINHKDCNKLNNHYSNFEYITPGENSAHARQNDRYEVLEDRYNASLTNEQVHTICKMLEDEKSYDYIMSIVNVSRDVLKKIKAKENYSEIADLYNIPQGIKSKYSETFKQEIMNNMRKGLTNKQVREKMNLDDSFKTLMKACRKRIKDDEGSTTSKSDEMVFRIILGPSHQHRAS